MYGEFAAIYDELMNDFDYQMWFKYIESIFEKYDHKGKNVLEMACGTGNLSEEIAKGDYNLTAFDLSDDMLVIGDSKLNKYRNVRLLKQDMTDFDFREKFDSVISICDSINYILEERDLRKVFKNVYEHLEEKGLFIFDINSRYKLTEVIGNNSFVEDRENIFYTWENFYDIEDDIVEFYLTFFVSDDGENYVRFNEDHVEKPWKQERIVEILKEVGFSQVDIVEAFSFEEVNDKTERINFIVRK